MTNKFTDITNQELRVWNRCAMIFNIMKDKGIKEGAKYASEFSIEERNQISQMYERINRDGYEQTRAAINRTVQCQSTGVDGLSATIAA